jgi:spore maturation protein CgeB
MIGVKIDVYGNNWKRYANHSNITIYPPAYGDDFWRVLRKYRVQLNLRRPHNLTTHNMRTFEAAGVGAIQLAPATEDHRLYFKENEEIFLFTDMDSCVKQVAEIKSLSIKKADSIRKNVRRRALADGYSYEKRSEKALSFIKALI